MSTRTILNSETRSRTMDDFGGRRNVPSGACESFKSQEKW